MINTAGQTWSIRQRVLMAVTATLVIAMAASGAVVYTLVAHSYYAESDAGLVARAMALVAELDWDDDAHQVVCREQMVGDREWSCRVETASGIMLAGDRRLPVVGSVPEPITLNSGQPARAVSLQQVVASEDPAKPQPVKVTVTVARSSAGVNAALERLSWTLVGATAVVASAGCLALVLAVSRALSPLDTLGRRLDALGPGEQVDLVGAPAELRQVVARLNGLLVRLENARERERAFTAAAAHELRTPLAGLLATIEVGLLRERSPVAYREMLESCLVQCRGMQSVVARLLLLGRLDAGQVVPHGAEVVLATKVESLWKPYASMAVERGLRVHWDTPPGSALVTDPELFGLVLSNLFDNAISHAPPGAQVTIKAGVELSPRGPAGVLVRVANDGCTLDPAQAGHLGERFWQADAARSTTGRHCGLGLALCREVTSILGGHCVFSVQDGWFVAEMRFSDLAREPMS